MEKHSKLSIIKITLLALILTMPSLLPAGGFTSLPATVPPGGLRPHSSLPNPDAPAFEAFMSGRPAGTALAAASWPLVIRVGVVRVEFQPDDNPATTGDGTWGDIPFFTYDENGNVVEDPTVDSRSKEYIRRNLLHVRQYYEEVSQGRVLFTVPQDTDISGIKVLPNEMAEYGKDDDYSLRTSQLAVDAIQAADSEMDYSQYDVIMVFHAGCGQHTDFDEESPDDIHPVSINRVLLREILADGDPSYRGIATNDRNDDGSQFHVSFVQMFPETAIQDYDLPEENGVKPNWPSGALQGLLGVIVHELGHYFGLPDLYDTYVGTRPTVGFYALMATGFYNTVSRIPCHPMAWCKVYLGWVEPYEVTGSLDNVLLKAADLWGEGHKIIKVPVSSTEYYLIENRLRDKNFNGEFDFDENGGNFFPDVMVDDYQNDDGTFAEFDWSIPNVLALDSAELANLTPAQQALVGSGVLIWHIDEEVLREKWSSDLVLNAANTDPTHLAVDLEEADGIEHLLEVFPASLDPGFGSPFDVFGGAVEGFKSASLGNLNTTFGPYTDPNSMSYTGLPSNIEISGFRSVHVSPGEPVVDSLVSIDIRFNAVQGGEHISHPLAGWPVPLPGETGLSSPVVFDLDPGFPGRDVFQVGAQGQLYIYFAGEVHQIGTLADSTAGSPAVGDIDGDSRLEFVVSGVDGELWTGVLRNPHIDVPFPDPASTYLAGRLSATPVLADVDGDRGLDVIVGTTTGSGGAQLHALSYSSPDAPGTEIAGFPVQLDGGIEAAAAVLHGVSGQAAMIYAGTLGGSLYGIGPAGEVVFRSELGSAVRCAPVVGRMGLPGTDEGFRVCAFTEDGRIWCFDSLGTLQSGWPVETGGSCLAGGAMGDVDGDGLNELAVPVDFPDPDSPGKHRLYVLEYNGSFPPGFPVHIGSPKTFGQERYLSAPALADLDGDQAQEIIFATRGRLALAYSGGGSLRPVARFILGSDALSTPVPADMDNDGVLDLVCADAGGFLYAYSTGSTNLDSHWPGLGGGPLRKGLSLRVQSDPGLTAGGSVLPEHSCYIYPNPVRERLARLAYRLGVSDVERVTVEVLTTSGERVDRFEGTTSASDGVTNEVVIDVDRYASGVYLVLLKAYSASSGTSELLRKFAVIK